VASLASEPQPPIRVLIADDEPHFRHGLRLVLESASGIRVVGEASDGETAIAQARRLAPDVVILDVHMPGVDGIAAARAIATSAPPPRILMLTVSDAAEDIAQASKAGAAGYLLKERSLRDIIDAVVTLARGSSWPAAAV
jgi:DNA-binding NarL/FixJ family response regulator